MWPGWNCKAFRSVRAPGKAKNLFRRTYHSLLSLRKVVAWVAVQRHLAQRRHWDQILRNDLGWVENVETKGQLILLVDDLNTEFPLWEIASLNRIEEILSVEIGVLSGHGLSFLPDKGSLSLERLEMELDEFRLAVIRHETEGVYTKAIHVAERTWNSVSRHGPHQRMHGARLLAEEIPGGIMSCSGLRNFTVLLGLDSVNQIGKLDGILDEEDGNVVSNDIYGNTSVIAVR